MSRTFWQSEFPIGDPMRGAPYGERTDPATIGMNIPAGQGPAAAMGGIGTIFNVIGNLGAGRVARQQGEAAQAAANFEAAQLDQAAGQQVAAAQRTALEQRRRAALIVSRGLAVAAASGAGASDPTVANLLADVEGEGAYRAGVALYEGEERARQLTLGADAKRFEGEIMRQGGRDKQRAYTIAGIGRGVAGAGSLYAKYGMGGPKRKNAFGADSGDGWLDAGTEGYSSTG